MFSVSGQIITVSLEKQTNKHVKRLNKFVNFRFYHCIKSYGSSLRGGIIILKLCVFFLNVVNSRCESRPFDRALQVIFSQLSGLIMNHLIKHVWTNLSLSLLIYEKCYLPLQYPCQAHVSPLLLQLF